MHREENVLTFSVISVFSVAKTHLMFGVVTLSSIAAFVALATEKGVARWQRKCCALMHLHLLCSFFRLKPRPLLPLTRPRGADRFDDWLSPARGLWGRGHFFCTVQEAGARPANSRAAELPE